MSARVAAVLLAAGASRRMEGENKLLVSFRGRPLVSAPAEALRAGGAGPIVVVTGRDADAVRGALAATGARFVHNERAHAGMGASIACGIAALVALCDREAEFADAGGVLVCLGDLPLLEAASVTALIERFAALGGPAEAIVAPVHAGERGHPVLFGRAHWPALAALADDRGARALISANADALHTVADPSPGIVRDVDDPESLAALRADD